MRTTEAIREMEKRLELNGDCELTFRDADDFGNDDIPIQSVFYDEDTDCIVISNQTDFFG